MENDTDKLQLDAKVARILGWEFHEVMVSKRGVLFSYWFCPTYGAMRNLPPTYLSSPTPNTFWEVKEWVARQDGEFKEEFAEQLIRIGHERVGGVFRWFFDVQLDDYARALLAMEE